MARQQPDFIVPQPTEKVDLIVIGAGPAGMAAAFTASSRGLSTVLVGEELGGRLALAQRQGSSGFREETDFTEMALLDLLGSAVLRQTLVLEAHVVNLKRQGQTFLVTTEGGRQLQSGALVIATGAVPMGSNPGGARATTLHGLHYASMANLHHALGQRVAVVGSTLQALITASELALLASHVSLVLDTVSHVDAQLLELLRAQPNVKLYEGYDLLEIAGEGQVESLLIESASASLRLEVAHVFIERGLVPNSGLLLALVDTDPEGFICIDAYHCTSCPGIFAAGDVTARPPGYQLAALGAGERAALSAYDHLAGQRLLANLAYPSMAGSPGS